MAIKQREQAVIDLVINGQAANANLRELTGTYNALFSSVSRLRQADDPEHYREQVALLDQVREARDAERRSVLGQTEATESYFDKFKEGFKEVLGMSGQLSAGTLIVRGVNAVVDQLKAVWDGAQAAFEESAKSQAQLEAGLRSTQGIAGLTKDALNDLAKAEMDKTAVDDDVVNKGEEMLLTFSNIRGKVYEAALPAIIDMTSALNQGSVTMETVQKNSILVGKALQDPIAGMTALRKVGVSLDEQQRDHIKTLVETNHMQEAQMIIIQELNKEFGKNAETVANSEAGELMRYETRIGNIQESLGQWIVKGKSLQVEVLNPLLGWIEDFLATPMSEKLKEDQRNLLAMRIELESTNTTTERRAELLKQLKEEYPGYLSQIDTDKAKNSELLPILDKINNAFVLRIAYQTRSESLDKAVKAQAEAINDVYDDQQHLILRIADIQQMLAEDGIKFTVKGNNETEKAIYIRKNLMNAIREQAKANTELNQVISSNKYDNLIASLNSYGNSLYSNKVKLKETQDETKKLTEDLNNFKKSSGFNDTIPGADMLNELANKVKVLQVVLDNTKKGSAEYVKIVDVMKRANAELANGANDKDVIKHAGSLIGEIDPLLAPQSGPTKDTQNKAAQALKKYNEELQALRLQSNQLAESARKGTLDDLDAQLVVIQDKYTTIINKIKELLKDPHTNAAIRKELTGKLDKLGKDEQLEKDNTTSDFNKKRDEQATKDNDEGLKNSSTRIDNIYASAQSDLDKQQNADLNNATGANPAIVEAKRLDIKQAYAQKSYELEQKHLEDLKTLNQTYRKDTAAIDKKIADNTIKENDRAANEKITKDKAYITTKKEISQMERDTLQQGAQFFESILNKRSALYAAALVVDKAVAAANIVIKTEEAIAAFTATHIGIPIVGAGAVAAYTTLARIQEGIALATIAVQTIQGVSGSTKKAAKGGYFEGASHDDGGLNVVDPKTGRVVVNVEGGEPFVVLSKETRKNNGALINQLLFNSMFRNGAAVDVAGVDRGAQIAKNGGVFSAAAVQAMTSNSNSNSTTTEFNPVIQNHFDTSELVTEMRLTRQAIKDQQIVFNNRLYKQFLEKEAAIQNRANA